MCWISDKAEPLISDGNVRVFKICRLKDGFIHSYYYGGVYELDKEYETKINISPNGNGEKYFGREGFHSYSSNDCYAIATVGGLQVFKIRTGLTYDLFITDYIGTYITGVVVVEGYLPKGATYYINNQKEIISNKIILTKVTQIK